MRHITHGALFGAIAAAGGLGLTGDVLVRTRASIAINLVTAVAIVVALRRHRPAKRASWVLLASAVGLFGVAGIVVNVADELGRPLSPGAARAAYSVGYVLLFAWAGSLRRSHGRMQRRGDRLDFALIVMAFVTPLYFLVLRPLAADSPLTGGDKAEALAHPVLALVLMVMTLRLTIGGKAVLSLHLLMASTAIATIGNVLLVTVQSEPTVVEGGRWSFALWWTAAALIIPAALHPSMRQVADANDARGAPGRLGTARTVGMGAALLTPTVTAVLVHAQSGTQPVAVIGPVAAMTVLLLVRLRDLLRESEAARVESDGVRAEVERQERYFRSIVRNVSDALVVTDHDGAITDVNTAFAGLFPAAVHGTRLVELLPGTDIVHLMLQVRGRPDTTALREATWRDHDGRQRWFEVTAANMLDDDAVRGVVWVLRDVSERHAFTERLRHQALHDALTGLPNRLLLTDRLETALARARRSGDCLAVFFIDVDNFKTINDGLGHDAGDRLLVAVSARLRGALRASDTLTRLGGDEFAVVAEGLDEPGARDAAARVRAAFADPFLVDGVRIPVTASVGVAFGRPDDPEVLFREADVAMYQAKATGKDGVVFFDDEMQLPVTERLETEMELLSAMERGELDLVYQPIVDVATGNVQGAEALLRWRHPVRGEVPPLRFVPVAEECGLMVPMGRWVLRTACTEAATWPRALDVAVNVSARQLDSPTFVTDVRAALVDSGLEPSRLVIELTESTIVRDTATAAGKLGELRALGVRVAVDDFGTGYSSLGQLRRLAVDILKIDRSFVSEIGRSQSGRAMVDALLRMARALGLEVVAEGVEDEVQVGALREASCESAQGFYFAHPLRVEEFRALTVRV